ncbi:hypothetical protein SAMN05660199_00077 [Klenkia soli]|uniref:Uncharacterized protein n=1 Tax=Klenkia soli TaxID=1052260 RepID=A0A1H0BPL0_9ACTN|nr:hypothetical protein [Klenkia soli]SDN47473.1 hypothetical protein SAMN05660199_00077 [Klenkia soli]
MNPWPFPASPDTLIFTTQPILDGAPVVDVHHDGDGDWQVLCGTTLDLEDARMVHFGHLVEMHPGLVALADLPPGWSATVCGDPGDAGWCRSVATDS